MLYGRSGSNGKSTLLNMITQLLGRENASFLSLQDTAERFRLVEVYGKAANIGDDIPSAYLPESSIFKKLVTGETVTAEEKRQEPVQLQALCRNVLRYDGLPAVSRQIQGIFQPYPSAPAHQGFPKADRM